MPQELQNSKKKILKLIIPINTKSSLTLAKKRKKQNKSHNTIQLDSIKSIYIRVVITFTSDMYTEKTKLGEIISCGWFTYCRHQPFTHNSLQEKNMFFFLYERLEFQIKELLSFHYCHYFGLKAYLYIKLKRQGSSRNLISSIRVANDCSLSIS